MSLAPTASRRVAPAIALAASAALHAVVLGGAHGWLPRPAPTAATSTAPIRVALLPAAGSAGAEGRGAQAAAPEPARPASAAPRPARRPERPAAAAARPKPDAARPPSRAAAPPAPPPAGVPARSTGAPPVAEPPSATMRSGTGPLASASDASAARVDPPPATADRTMQDLMAGPPTESPIPPPAEAPSEASAGTPAEPTAVATVDTPDADHVPSATEPMGEGWFGHTDRSPETGDAAPRGPIRASRRGAAPTAAAAVAASPAEASRGPTGPLPAPPGTVHHRFRVYWGDFADATSVARLEYRLTHDGERYEIRTSAEAEGLLSFVWKGTLAQVSEGRIGPDGFEPLRYAEQRGRRPERTVSFDPDAQRLLPAGGAPVPMPDGTQDRLSVIYQIGLLARADPSGFVAGETRALPVATMREVRVERFTVVGDETLMTPGGAVRAVHLRRPSPAGSDEPGIDLWLGYDHGMLPVRLRIEDANRRVLDQVIETGG